MTTPDDLPTFTADQIEEQLRELVFESFDQEAAYSLGTLAAEIVRERGFALAVQVVLGDHIVYKAALGGVEQGTTDWLRRKANVAVEAGVPSLLVRRRAEARGEEPFEDADHASHGGAFPILVAGEVVGTITGSGQPDVVDHDVVVSALRSYLAN